MSDWSDSRLVQECLDGNEHAWAALIHKYKRLIYSIPFKYRATPEDSEDIFQAVCLDLYSELPNLRKAESIRSWLISVTAHKSYRWKKRLVPGSVELDGMDEDQAHAQIPDKRALPPEILEEAEREQIVRDALKKLPARCVEMIQLLFLEQPPLPYNEVAQRLGLATGSIGFIRGRCLNRLQKILTDMGL
jgi:RNA polymerase sigma factor (sigma-70 family)